MAQTTVLRTTRSRSSVVPSPFSCSWSPGGLAASWIHLAGELDLASVPRLKEALRDAQAVSFMVLVDLRDLEFIGCAALGILVAADAHARASRKSLVLLTGAGQVDRMLKLTGLLEELEVIDPGASDSQTAPATSGQASTHYSKNRVAGTTVMPWSERSSRSASALPTPNSRRSTSAPFAP